MTGRKYAPLYALLIALSVSLPVARTHAQDQATPPSAAKAQQLVQSGEFDEAATIYAALVKQQPNNGQHWFMYGYSLHGAGRLEQAIEVHKKAATFPQGRSVATYNLGCAYALLGRPDEAFEALNAAAEMGGVNPTQWSSDSDLDSLKEDTRWSKLLGRVKELNANPLNTALKFWVGEWDVYNRQGGKAGENSIAYRDNKRVIYEVWKSAGGIGESFNYFEPVSRQWKQVWVDGTGNVLEMAGTFRDGALRFEGTELRLNGSTAMHRTTLTPLEGGRVRQYIENSSDSGETWQVAYDFIYMPKGESFVPLEEDEEGDGDSDN